MAKYGTKFTFGNQSSDDFGVVLAGGIDSFEMGLERSLIRGDMNRYRTRINHLGAKYQDSLSFTFTVIKNPCLNRTQEAMLFTRKEVRALNAWLTGSDYPQPLHFEDGGEYIVYFATITNVENETIGTDIYSLTYTAVCDSPFAYSEIFTRECDSSQSADMAIQVDSDDAANPVYPTITITPKSTGAVTITNITDNHQSITLQVKRDLQVIINCRLQQFTDGADLIDLSDIGLADESDLYIPRLLNGSNSLHIDGNCHVKLEYRCPRKAGAC